jgi:hypothetical protein
MSTTPSPVISVSNTSPSRESSCTPPQKKRKAKVHSPWTDADEAELRALKRQHRIDMAALASHPMYRNDTIWNVPDEEQWSPMQEDLDRQSVNVEFFDTATYKTL